MRIAYFVHQFPSISETFVLDQITGLMDRGHEVDIYASRPQPQSVFSEVADRYGLESRTYYHQRPPANYGKRVAHALRSAAGRGRRAKLLGRSLSRRKYGRFGPSLQMYYWALPMEDGPREYDVLHAHFGPNGIRANLLRRLGVLSGPLVTTFHGFDMTHYVRSEGNSVYTDLFREGELFLPISARWRDRLLEMGCPKDRVAIHRMGIDCARFSPRAGAAARGPVRLLSIARLVEKKGIQFAIRALRQMGIPAEEVRYDIVGDGPLRKSLEGLVQELDLTGVVRFLGWQPKESVARLMDTADILVAPSVTAANGDQEGIPVALMEAMSTGIPVVSTWHSGIPELVEDGVSGLLAGERDVEGLAAHIARLVRAPELRGRIGLRGREKVVQDFNLERLNDRLEELLGSIQPRSSRLQACTAGS